MLVAVMPLDLKHSRTGISALSEMVEAACREEQQIAPQAAAILELGLADLIESLSCGDGGWWVAWRCGLPVGVLRVLPPDEPGASRVMLVGLYVKPAFRRQGIASSLVTAACKRAANVGFATVRALVAERNPAMRLYRRLGFKVTRAAALPGYSVVERAITNWL